jgi:glycosyltransferase involved in cell wall biosynthesis
MIKGFHFVQYVSILIASHNTPEEFLIECLDSIQNQKDIPFVSLELVWINDGSSPLFTNILEKCLRNFQKKIKQKIKIKYLKLDKNQGLSYCLHHGVLACSHDIIFRMDSDDIMHELRIRKQLDFINNNPKCVLCGTDIFCFTKTKGQKYFVERSEHPAILTWDSYLESKPFWILNHPTLCFRKYAVISAGNYNPYLKYPFEDLDLELRILKKYGVIYNIPEMLLYYRIHENQITWKNRKESKANNEKKRTMIEHIIHSS